jgi:hypothetical protein
MPETFLLDNEEWDVIGLLSEAYNRYRAMKRLLPDDLHEFTMAIHAAQNIVFARPVMRQMYARDEPMQKPTVGV